MSHLDPTHPAPFLQRAWTCLDGPWACAVDEAGAYATPADVAFDDEIVVPFAPETPASGVHHPGRVGVIWYQRLLDDPGLTDGERLLVHFGGVDRVADVWVDGHHLCHHVGGYTGFSIDVTDHVAGGATLVVRAEDDASDLEVPRGKQDWNDTPHAIWYARTTGIWKTVWTERVPAARVDEIRWTADPATMTLRCRIRLTGPRPVGTTVAVHIGLGDRTLVDDRIGVTGTTVDRTFSIGDGGFDDRLGLLWWPARPVLLDATVTVSGAGGPDDEVRSYAAMRSVDVADGAVRINGRPYPLRLVLDQGYWPDTGATPPDADALVRDIELTRALGFNGARKHQKIEDARYFAAADRMGLLTWVEMPSAYACGPRTAQELLAEWPAIVAAHANHPSVIAWVPVNESWGVDGCEIDPTQHRLIDALSAAADAVDGSRPVSANDGWETSGGDIVGVHDYDQDPASLASRWGSLATIDAVLTGRRPDGKLADLHRRPAGGRAVVLSEFGGIALDTSAAAMGFGTANWGYDTAMSPEDLVERCAAQWTAVHASSGLAGACWTQLTDTGQEVNGLLRADRTPKADLPLIAAAVKGR